MQLHRHWRVLILLRILDMDLVRDRLAIILETLQKIPRDLYHWPREIREHELCVKSKEQDILTISDSE